MEDLIQIIKGRRSVRAFQDKDIPENHLDQILESVKWCPSWANTQCWEVVIIRDPVRKERLQEVLSNKNPSTRAMVEAPVIIALCGKTGIAGYYKDRASTKLGDWYMFDLGIATMSLCLMAHSLGLGTVIVGAFDHDRGKEVLMVKDGYELVALIPLGYPAKDSHAPKRREIGEFTHNEEF